MLNENGCGTKHAFKRDTGDATVRGDPFVTVAFNVKCHKEDSVTKNVNSGCRTMSTLCSIFFGTLAWSWTTMLSM